MVGGLLYNTVLYDTEHPLNCSSSRFMGTVHASQLTPPVVAGNGPRRRFASESADAAADAAMANEAKTNLPLRIAFKVEPKIDNTFAHKFDGLPASRLGPPAATGKLKNSSNIYFAMPWGSKNWKTHVDY